MPQWLKNAVFYEIYPQSFNDTNGDGIGDIQGIIEKLDYVKGLGCDSIWLNPIYDSPFMDAGYDVRDYYKVAPRYGTNDDLVRLFDEAHKRDMHILLDLVPGHTSEQHPWFLEAKKAEKNQYSDRYIFTKSVWDAPPEYRMMCGICQRDGNYMVNYFSSQPALNYGFYKIDHPEWQLPCDSPEAKATAEEIKNIMRFWLDKGADGFRVDMADSLVKNDDDKIATAKIWKDIREMLDKEYPNAAMVSEWCNPVSSINNGGFHMDFYLDHYGNGYSRLFRYEEDGENKAFFHKNGKGDITAFLEEYIPNLEKTNKNGYISFMTNNHDMPRMTRYADKETIKLAYATMFTLPGVPFLYYGDEIGMAYQSDLVSKEGGFSRTGSRTPMQWDSSKNLGFSTADECYLPVETGENAPTVENQMNDPDSIYKVVTDVIALRKSIPDLGNDGTIDIVYARKNSYPFVFKRGSYVISVNPSGSDETIPFDFEVKETVYSLGETEVKNGKLTAKASSFVIYKV